MAIQSVEDNVASRLDSPLSASSEALTTKNEFIDMSVPPEGYLVLGNNTDLQPSADGSHPTGEVVKYTTFTRNGDGTATFGEVSADPLDRGWGNTNAQEWIEGTPVGLAISSAYMNIIMSAIVPQDNGLFKYQNIDSTSTIDDELQPGGNIELDIRDWYRDATSGKVSSGDVATVHITRLPDQQTISVDLATLIMSDGQPVPSGVDLIIATLDNNGGGSRRSVILSGDGSTVYDREVGSPIASYENISGAAQTVMVGVDNGNFNAGTATDQDIVASMVAKIT